MSTFAFLIISVVGFFVTGWSATATKVLQDFSRRELEVYCRRRNRLDLFGEILDEDEQVLVAEMFIDGEPSVWSLSRDEASVLAGGEAITVSVSFTPEDEGTATL